MRRRCLALVLSLTRYRKVIITPAEILGLMVPCKIFEPVDTLFLTCTFIWSLSPSTGETFSPNLPYATWLPSSAGSAGTWGGTEGVRRGGRPRSPDGDL